MRNGRFSIQIKSKLQPWGDGLSKVLVLNLSHDYIANSFFYVSNVNPFYVDFINIWTNSLQKWDNDKCMNYIYIYIYIYI